MFFRNVAITSRLAAFVRPLRVWLCPRDVRSRWRVLISDVT